MFDLSFYAMEDAIVYYTYVYVYIVLLLFRCARAVQVRTDVTWPQPPASLGGGEGGREEEGFVGRPERLAIQ